MGKSAYSIAVQQMGELIKKANLSEAAVKEALGPIDEQLADIATSVKKYGAIGDGVADDTAAFIAALADRDEITVPQPSAFYRITDSLALASNKRIIGTGSRPEIKLDSSTVSLLFNMDNSEGILIENLTLNGNKTITPTGVFVSLNNATKCTIRECVVNDAPSGLYGTIVLSGAAQDNLLEDNEFNNTEGIAVGVSGLNTQYNTISHNKFTDSASFGIRVGEHANRNEIVGNKTTSNGLELIGITGDCFMNRIAFNHAEGCGDNGISISGFNNTAIGNVCRRNYGAGIHIWGSFNTIVGNECLNNNQSNNGNNWSGIGVSANYGACGQFNTIVGNLCDDDQVTPTQWNGVRIAGSSYVQWAEGQTVSIGQYRVNGLNIYFAVSNGATGPTAPVHASGEVSDGGVTWRYMRTFMLTVGSRYNTVAENTVPRFQSGDYVDTADNWSNNTLISRSKTDHRVVGEYRVGVGASNAFIVNVGNADKILITNNDIRPNADAAMKLGLTNRQWSEVYGLKYFSGANQVLAARRTGWTSPAGTVNRASFDTATVTTAELAQRVKGLIDDFIAHGLIGP